MFMETLDRLLVGEAVSERSGDETEAVVAVDEVEFIFLTCKKKTCEIIPFGIWLQCFHDFFELYLNTK